MSSTKRQAPAGQWKTPPAPWFGQTMLPPSSATSTAFPAGQFMVHTQSIRPQPAFCEPKQTTGFAPARAVPRDVVLEERVVDERAATNEPLVDRAQLRRSYSSCPSLINARCLPRQRTSSNSIHTSPTLRSVLDVDPLEAGMHPAKPGLQMRRSNASCPDFVYMVKAYREEQHKKATKYVTVSCHMLRSAVHRLAKSRAAARLRRQRRRERVMQLEAKVRMSLLKRSNKFYEYIRLRT